MGLVASPALTPTENMKTEIQWTQPFHGLSHLGQLRDVHRASVQVLGSLGKAELHKWYAGCGLSPIVEIHSSARAAKAAGEAWVEEALK